MVLEAGRDGGSDSVLQTQSAAVIEGMFTSVPISVAQALSDIDGAVGHRGRQGKRDPNARAIRMPKRLRHDADDGVRSAVEKQNGTDDIRARVQILAPKIIAHDRDCGPASAIFLLGKTAAARRRETENGEKVRADARGRHAARGRRAGAGARP